MLSYDDRKRAWCKDYNKHWITKQKASDGGKGSIAILRDYVHGNAYEEIWMGEQDVDGIGSTEGFHGSWYRSSDGSIGSCHVHSDGSVDRENPKVVLCTHASAISLYANVSWELLHILLRAVQWWRTIQWSNPVHITSMMLHMDHCAIVCGGVGFIVHLIEWIDKEAQLSSLLGNLRKKGVRW